MTDKPNETLEDIKRALLQSFDTVSLHESGSLSFVYATNHGRTIEYHQLSRVAGGLNFGNPETIWMIPAPTL